MAREAGRHQHAREAPRRPRQSGGPREVQLRHQPARHDLREDRPLAASARAHRQRGPVRGAPRARREGRARLEGRRTPRRCTRATRSRPSRPTPKSRRSTPLGWSRSPTTCCQHVAERRAGDGRRRAEDLRVAPGHGRQPAQGQRRRDRQPRRRLQGRGAHRRADLPDPCHHARLHGVARLRLRVGRRQADGVGVHAGRARHEGRLRAGPQDSERQRPRHHAVHGRRVREQVRPRRAGPHLREARAGSQAAGEAVPRSQRGAPRHGQPAVGVREDSRRRLGGRQAHGVRRAELGHGRRGRGLGFPAAVHLPVPEPPAAAHRRLHQRGPAARDARAGPPAGLLPHRNPDGRARRSRPHGSGRVPHQEPADGGAQPRVGRLLPAGRESVRLGKTPRDRRPDARARSRTASACRRTSGAAAAAAAARTATSRPTAAS